MRGDNKRYIHFKVDDAGIGALPAARAGKRLREPCSIITMRCVRFCGFFLACTWSWLHALGPWMLSMVEVTTMLLLVLLSVRPTPRPWRFNFRTCLEDVVAASVVRAIIISAAYAYSSRRYFYRAYLYTSYAVGSAGFVYALVKGALFEYDGAWLPPAAVIVTFATFSWAHILAARRTVDWARRRTSMGLMGMRVPWGEGEESWLLLRRSASQSSWTQAPASQADAHSDALRSDLPPEALAEADSQFVEVDGLRVHVREVSPYTPPPVPGELGSEEGVVLIHGFGGGTFSWRHVQEPLALHSGVRVVAFDRPGFGLTERPRVGPGSGASPYTVASQAHLVLSLCQALGLKRVVLVGQADGCLVALMAASLAARGAALQAQQQAQSGNGHAAQQQLPGAVSIDMTAEVGSPAPPSTSALPANSDLSWMGSYGPDPTPRALNNVLHALRGLAAQQAWSQDSGSFHSACGPPSSSAASLGAGGDASGAAQAPGVASSAASSSAALAALTPATAALGAAGQASEAGASSTSSEAGPQPPRAPPQGGGRGDSPGSAWIAPDVPEMCREAEGGEEIRSIGSSVSSLAGSAVLREPPQIAGLVLLHPNLSGHLVSAFARLLSKTQLGRSMLRPLLRTEIGEVANRRAWHNSEQLTREVLELYKRPLRVEGWDFALLEVTRPKQEPSHAEVLQCFVDVHQLPALLITGQHDRVATPSKVQAMHALLPQSTYSLVPSCGHLSHEESPAALLAALQQEVGQRLRSS